VPAWLSSPTGAGEQRLSPVLLPPSRNPLSFFAVNWISVRIFILSQYYPTLKRSLYIYTRLRILCVGSKKTFPCCIHV
jgi:hypothetical protein